MPQHSFRNVNGPKRKLVVGSSAISLAVILWLWPPAARSVNMLPAALAPAGLHGPYSTNFPRVPSLKAANGTTARRTALIGPTSGQVQALPLGPKSAGADRSRKNTMTPRLCWKVLGGRTKRSRARFTR